jgi:hypothetical protein
VNFKIISSLIKTNMKKRILSITVVAAVAVVAVWSFNQSSNETVLADVALDNIEALAGGEGGTGGLCSKSGQGCIINYTDGSSTFVVGKWN